MMQLDTKTKTAIEKIPSDKLMGAAYATLDRTKDTSLAFNIVNFMDSIELEKSPEIHNQTNVMLQKFFKSALQKVNLHGRKPVEVHDILA